MNTFFDVSVVLTIAGVVFLIFVSFVTREPGYLWLALAGLLALRVATLR